MANAPTISINETRTSCILNLKRYIVVLGLLSFISGPRAQSFDNPDLEDPLAIWAAPTGWELIPETDPIFNGATIWTTSADILGLTGAGTVTSGIIGNPYSGLSFSSGLMFIRPDNGQVYHEGIKQTVSGFDIGSSYTVNFFQSVVKQFNALDGSGSWSVYVDNDLIGVSDPTVSGAAFNSTSFIWEQRSFTFTASSSDHTIKFLATDDDPDHFRSETNLNGALRMGIDSISLGPGCSISPLALGSDTTVCDPGSLILDVTTSDAEYLWQDNTTGSSITVSESGTYWVTVSTDDCSISDTLIVDFGAAPTIDLGSDQLLCPGESVTLDASTSNAEYVWQNNSTAATMNVIDQGVYWVEVTVDNCSTIDSVYVEYYLLSGLGNDTVLCEDESMLLNAFSAHATFVWQDNSTFATYMADGPGTYWVQTTIEECVFIDTLVIAAGLSPSSEDLSFDICEGQFIDQSSIPPDLQIQASDQDITNTLFTESIVIAVQISNGQCSIEDSIHVTVVEELTLDLGEDFATCIGSEVALTPDISGQAVMWQDGSESEELIITDAGLYSASLENVCGITSDSILIELIDCDTTLFIPNAFTPDDDGVNDLFLVQGNGVAYFEISIYDRWGGLVFQSNDIEMPWNGGVHGSEYYVQDGIYSYVVDYAFEIDDRILPTPDYRKYGFITILR